MKRLRVILVFVAVLLGGLLVILFSRPGEPSYQGRRLSQWLDEYEATAFMRVQSTDTKARSQAAHHAVKMIGTNAIPFLIQWLQFTNSPSRDRYNLLLSKQKLIRFRFETERHANNPALRGFGILRDDAQSAAPELARLLESPRQDQRYMAIECLVVIDSEQHKLLPVFLQAFKSTDFNTRMWAGAHLRDAYPAEAEKAGVALDFPGWKPAVTGGTVTNTPAAK